MFPLHRQVLLPNLGSLIWQLCNKSHLHDGFTVSFSSFKETRIHLIVITEAAFIRCSFWHVDLFIWFILSEPEPNVSLVYKSKQKCSVNYVKVHCCVTACQALKSVKTLQARGNLMIGRRGCYEPCLRLEAAVQTRHICMKKFYLYINTNHQPIRNLTA